MEERLVKVKCRIVAICAVLTDSRCRQSLWGLIIILASLTISNNSCFQSKIKTRCTMKLYCSEKPWKLNSCRSMTQVNFQVIRFKFTNHLGGLHRRIKTRTKIWWNLNRSLTIPTIRWCYREKASPSSIQETISRTIRLSACNLSSIWITSMNHRSWCSEVSSAMSIKCRRAWSTLIRAL